MSRRGSYAKGVTKREEILDAVLELDRAARLGAFTTASAPSPPGTSPGASPEGTS